LVAAPQLHCEITLITKESGVPSETQEQYLTTLQGPPTVRTVYTTGHQPAMRFLVEQPPLAAPETAIHIRLFGDNIDPRW
jgi:hypothetical protein